MSKAFFTSDKEAFLCIRLRMTPQYSIDRSQRTVESHGCLRLETRFIIGIFGNRNKNNDKDLIMSDVCSNVVGTLLCVANGHIIY